MSTIFRATRVNASGTSGLPNHGGISPGKAILDSFSDTVQLLLNPFDLGRWFKLSAICLLLGGGTASAAFHWILSTLPGDLGFQQAVDELKAYLAGFPGFLYLSVASVICLGLAIIYGRATCRFALVESILRGEARFRIGWQERLPLARSYFWWMVGTLAVPGCVLAAGVILALPRLRDENYSVAQSIILAGVLFAEVAVGLVAALLITLTDDFAVPLMYAEKLSLPAAWRRLAGILRAETPAFTVYFLVRLVISAAVGVAVLFVLFPALVALFSSAVVVGAVVVLTLHFVGLAWVWTPLTIIIAALALLALSTLTMLILGLAGMPGQVFLQTFAMRFLSPRLPALQSRWQGSSPSQENE
ncbi:MAG: hypothetical protein ACE145_08255 [Terriglobia bacterium]